jgi:hypothetical protein
MWTCRAAWRAERALFNDPDPREAGLILQGIGLALIIVYAVTVTAVAVPVELLQPQWIEKVSGSLRGGASFPLVGAGLMVMAELLDPGSWRLARRVGRIRGLALWAALGFVMLIPLQIAVGINLQYQQKHRNQAVVKEFSELFTDIRVAPDEASLKQAIARLPGAPPILPERFRDPLPKVKQEVLDQLNPQLQDLNRRQELEQGQGWRSWSQATLKDSLVNALFAMAFLVVAQPSLIGRFIWDAQAMAGLPEQPEGPPLQEPPGTDAGEGPRVDPDPAATAERERS